MEKGVADRWTVFAFYNSTSGGGTIGAGATGDADQITATLYQGGSTSGASTTTSHPLELSGGFYEYPITSAESNTTKAVLIPDSSTSGIEVRAIPPVIYPRPVNFNMLGIESDGDVTKVNTLDGHTAQTGDVYLELPSNFSTLSISTAGNANTDVKINSDKTGYGLADDAITSAKFDESTAFPLAKADSGNDELARTGADGDTLEDLSDQIDDIPTNSELASAFTEIKGTTWAGTDTLENLYDGLINNQLVTSTVGGKVDDVKAKTDNLPSDPADQSAVEAAITAAHSTTDGLITTADAVVDLIYGIVNSGTFGNSALKTLIDLCSTHSAADVKTAMEADNSDLDYLVTDLINKKKITILSGATVQYNDSDVSIGTISAAYSDDGTDVIRKRMVQVK